MFDLMYITMASPWVPTMLHVWRDRLYTVLKVTYLPLYPMTTH